MSGSRRAFVLLCALAVTLVSAAAVSAEPPSFAGGPPLPVGGGKPVFAGGPPPGVGGGVPGFLTRDSVVGSGTLHQFGSPVEIAADASSNADGSDPQGTVVVTATFLDGERTLHGDVSQGCMITMGNEVVVVGKIPPEEQWFTEGFGTVEYAYAMIVDNGTATGDAVDYATGRGLRESTKLAVCGGAPIREVWQLESGDFTVIDN